MGGSFQTEEGHRDAALRPIRVALRKEHLWARAQEMVEDLPRWEMVSRDDASMRMTCRRPGGFLAGEATITIRVEGPEDLPSSAVQLEAEASGFLARPSAVALEFLRPFRQRVC